MSDAFSKTTVITMLWAVVLGFGGMKLDEMTKSIREVTVEVKNLNKFAVQTLHSHDLRLTRVEDKIQTIERNQDGNQ